MNRKAYGFTIVELLIVIVVVGILAAISIVAYNGVAAKARDAQRHNDAKNIIKALELYRVERGAFPATTATPTANTPGCTSMATGYSYSYATDSTWLRPLVQEGIVDKVPVSNPSNCDTYYRYIKGSPTTWGCTTLTKGWYMLTVHGAEGTIMPPEAATFKPCPEATVTTNNLPSRWVFFGYDN